MNDYEKRAFIAASGQVLTKHLPEDFDKLDCSALDEWVECHAWEPFENWSANQLLQQIDSVSNTLRTFHASELELVLANVQ